MADMSIEGSRKYSLSLQIYNKIREEILTGVYEEGKLLQEVKISEEFGVSRTPVREALKQLEQEGLVVMMPNKIARVSSISASDIEDIYEIRGLIEGLAARWAAEKINDEQLKEMEEILDLAEFYTSKNNYENVTVEDSRFHQALYNACNSKYLQHILTDFHQYSLMSRRRSFSSEGRAEKALEEHKAILEALKERDSKKAEKSANEHVQKAKENLLRKLK